MDQLKHFIKIDKWGKNSSKISQLAADPIVDKQLLNDQHKYRKELSERVNDPTNPQKYLYAGNWKGSRGLSEMGEYARANAKKEFRKRNNLPEAKTERF